MSKSRVQKAADHNDDDIADEVIDDLDEDLEDDVADDAIDDDSGSVYDDEDAAPADTKDQNEDDEDDEYRPDIEKSGRTCIIKFLKVPKLQSLPQRSVEWQSIWPSLNIQWLSERGQRILQMDIDPEGLYDPCDIAKKEIDERKCPLSISRKISNDAIEVWEVNEMIRPIM